MKKAILIFISFLLILPFSLAAFPFDDTPFNRTTNYSCASNAAFQQNWSSFGGSSGCIANYVSYPQGTSGTQRYLHNTSRSFPWAGSMNLTITSATATCQIFSFCFGNVTGGATDCGNSDASGGTSLGLRSSGADNFELFNFQAGTNDPCPALKVSQSMIYDLKFIVSDDGGGDKKVNLTVNSTRICSLAWHASFKPTTFLFEEAQAGTTSCGFNASEIVFFNQSEYAGALIPDTTPPEITYYNLTNGNGCEVWNTNKNSACNTTSATPTVQFNTNEGAWCAIAASTYGTLDKNYTDMGSSRNCTGAAAGESTTSHLCTVTLQDEIVYEPTYIYISCKDANNHQNKTSTSGALNISVTVEQNARDAMEAGIRNSLSSSYTIYTDQKIYARNSANQQGVGTFDKVVKWLTKIWAFNRIGATENNVNLFNITPVFYNLEIANKTATYIENQTALVINSTK